MTPAELMDNLLGLGIIYQVKQRGGYQNPLLDMFKPPKEPREDYLAAADESEEEKDLDTLDIVTDPDFLYEKQSWFLGANPMKEIKGRIVGKVMSCAIKERTFFIWLEHMPWGVKAGEIKFNCEELIDLQFKSGTLYIQSKVGNVAIQIHELSSDQCKRAV